MTGVALLDQHLLSVLIALPLIGAALLLFFPREGDDAIRKFTFLVTADQVEAIVIGMMKVVSIRIQREIPSTPTM